MRTVIRATVTPQHGESRMLSSDLSRCKDATAERALVRHNRPHCGNNGSVAGTLVHT
jgi:hypothetical protein